MEMRNSITALFVLALVIMAGTSMVIMMLLKYAYRLVLFVLFQIDMKDKLSPDQLASLTREYHRTYGSLTSDYQGVQFDLYVCVYVFTLVLQKVMWQVREYESIRVS